MMRLAVFLLTALSLQPAHADTELPVDAGAIAVGDLFKVASFRDAVLSPDGKYVALIEETDIQHQTITLIDLTKETSTDIVGSADQKERFTDLMWVSNDTVAYYDHIGSDATRLIAAHWSGFKGDQPLMTLTIWPGDVWIVDRLIHDGENVLLGRRSGACLCIYNADINSGDQTLTKAMQVAQLDPATDDVVTDRTGKVVATSRADKDGIRHFFVLDPKGRENWRDFKTISDRKVAFTLEMAAPDGHDFYVLSNQGRDTVGYFEDDPDTDKFVRTVYANETADVVGFSYDPETDAFIYLKWLDGTEPQYEVLDPRAKVQAQALQEAFPGQRAVPTAISADGREMLVFVYSDVNPGAYYAFDIAKRQAELLGAQQPWLPPSLMAPVRSGSLKTSDGFTVNYLVTVPKAGHGPFPMVVIPHGGPIGIFDSNGFDPETQLLVSRGYAVLKVNYRGSGGSGARFETAGNHQWGRKIEDDIEQVVHAVIHTSPVDPDRVCIYGASYGGYSALMSMIRDPALFKCAASYAGVTDLPLLYDTTDVQFDKQVRDEMADIIGDPTTDAAKLRAISPVYLADKIKRPVLLAQGGEDTRVDMEQAYRLKLVMETLKKPVEFKFFPYEIHGFRYSEDATDFYLRLLDFLGRYIASNRPVMPPPAP